MSKTKLGEFIITVFTPTYNRLELLQRVYESLCAQTSQNFIWLVVDDGSTDGTATWMKNLSRTSKLKIEYFFQPNGGKHRATNLAVSHCYTPYFFFLDSDDFVSKDCIEVLGERLKAIDGDERISGILGSRCNPGIKKQINIFSKIAPCFSTEAALNQKFGFHGETLRLYKTKILKKFPFPEIEGEDFMQEGVVFRMIDQKYNMLVIPETLYFSQYHQDGYTRNIRKILNDNPIGYALSLWTTYVTAATIRKKFSAALVYDIWCKKYNVSLPPNIKTLKRCHILPSVISPLSHICLLLRRPRSFFKS